MNPQPVSTPIWVGEVDLDGPLVSRGISRDCRPDDTRARLLVWLDRRPLGFIEMPLTGGEPAAGAIATAVDEQLAEPLARRREAAAKDRRPGRTAAGEPITVVVCTRDRPEILGTCLRQLQGLEYPDVQVVVVDNAPSTEATRERFEELTDGDARFRYVREPRPGLSNARNRGLQEARTRYVAFTDDDVQVDRRWLDGIMAGFARDPRAGCVTGLVPAAELDHASQQYFERRYSWSAGLEPNVFDLTNGRAQSRLYPFSAGVFGTGANFAVDRVLMLRLGGFDPALGAGSKAGGGEDLDAFVRVLRAGRTLVYEPAAVVWHTHRAGEEALRRQLYFYGVGLTAFLAKYLLDWRTAGEILARVPEGIQRGRAIWNVEPDGARAGRHLIGPELVGMAMGPVAYLRGRRA